VECATNTFDGLCRVVAVPADRGLQLWCDANTQIKDVISLPALALINVTMFAEGCFGVYGCQAQTISFPRLQMVRAAYQGAGGYEAFRVNGVPNLVVMDFPVLKSISGGTGLMISDAPALEDLHFPSLMSIDSLNDGIYIAGKTQLQQLVFPLLQSVSLIGTNAISIVGKELFS
jgi:hypothetical protein